MASGYLGGGEIPRMTNTVIYELNNADMEIAAVTVNVTNDHIFPVNISFGFTKSNDISSFSNFEFNRLLNPGETLERTGIVMSLGEKIVAHSDQGEVYWRVHGYEENISNLYPANIKWVTESELGELSQEYIMQDLIANGAENYNVEFGNLPFGLTLNSHGLLSGKNPRDDQQYEIIVKASKKNKKRIRKFTFTCKNTQPVVDDIICTIPRTLYKGMSAFGEIYGGRTIYKDVLTYKLHLPTGFTANKTFNIINNEQLIINVDNNVPADQYYTFVIECNDNYTGKQFKNIEIFVANVDSTPNEFTFTDLIEKDPNTYYESDMVLITGLHPNITFFPTVAYGEFRISTQPLTSNIPYTNFLSSGIKTDNNGMLYAQLKTNSSSLFNKDKIMEFTIGSVTKYWKIRTRNIDNNPDDFTIPKITNAELDTDYESSIVTITGLEKGYEVLVVCNKNGFIDVEGENTFTNIWSTSKLVKTDINGTIRLKCKMKSAMNFLDTKVMSVRIGNVDKDFIIENREFDTTPNDFNIPNITDAELNKEYTSQLVTITGLEKNANITVSCDIGLLDVSGEYPFSTVWSNIKIVKTDSNGELKLLCKMNSASLNGTTTTMNVTVGKLTKPFNIKTVDNSATDINMGDSMDSYYANPNKKFDFILKVPTNQSGTIMITYDMYGAADKLDIMADGLVAITTGSRAGKGTISYYYDHTKIKEIRIRMNDGKLGSQWEFKVAPSLI